MSTNRLDEILNYSAIAYATLADYVTPITETDVETFENYADMYCQKGNEHPEARTTRDNDIRTILGNKILSDPRVSTNTLISMKLGMIFGNTELWEDISSISELTDEKIAKLYGTSVDNVQMMHTFSAKAKELEEAKNNFKDATHYTYAYIIDEARKSSDDGEPGGTAGVPIMEVLLKHELNYVLCIVIRYFGGIKLGTGGLVRAYRKSACIGIDNSTLLNLVDGYKIEITASYEEQKNIEKLIKNYTFSKTYTDIVKYELNIKQDDINILNSKNVNYKILKALKIEL